jgi:hypothetical protein
LYKTFGTQAPPQHQTPETLTSLITTQSQSQQQSQQVLKLPSTNLLDAAFDFSQLFNLISSPLHLKYSLFFALERGRTFHDQTIIQNNKSSVFKNLCTHKNLVTNKQFWKMKSTNPKIIAKNEEIEKEKILQIIKSAGICFESLNQLAITQPYYIPIAHFDLMQKYYDKTFPGLYRIVVFGRSKTLQPLFKGPTIRKYCIPIFYDEPASEICGTYYAIKNIVKFLKIRSYCVDCEFLYQRDHKCSKNLWAKAMCVNCENVVECPAEPSVYIECQKCRRVFRNKICHENHQKNWHLCSDLSDRIMTPNYNENLRYIRKSREKWLVMDSGNIWQNFHSREKGYWRELKCFI